MISPVPALADPIRADGARRFSRWNPDLFDAVARGPAVTLADALDGEPDSSAVLTGYLQAVQQAVGLGLLTQTDPGPAGWANVLERLLVEVVPAQLPAVHPDRRLATLVEVWNLAEGVLREPVWVDRYVTACVPKLDRLDHLEAFLVGTLEPVLTPPPPATWSGKHRLGTLDLRPVHDDFLPGTLRLAAPGVLCVGDRRRPGLQIGVILRPGGRSELIGVVAGLGEYQDPGPLPAIEFADGRVTVAGHAIPVPTLRRCQGWAVARSGFVTLCAPDSQRLWVIECG